MIPFQGMRKQQSKKTRTAKSEPAGDLKSGNLPPTKSQPQVDDDEWQKVWDARVTALAAILGKPADHVLHAVVPFQLGGSADVLPFPDYVPGMTYVTADLTGEDTEQQPSGLGNYELMICTRQKLQKAADLISNLARYTTKAVLEPGETMDLGTYLGDSTIRALLFTHPGEHPVHLEFLWPAVWLAAVHGHHDGGVGVRPRTRFGSSADPAKAARGFSLHRARSSLRAVARW